MAITRVNISAESGACLALVRCGLQHGYPIAQEFSEEGSVGVVLTATRPVVYRELALLETQGMLAAKADRGVRGQAKKTLKLTAAGNKALDAWLAEPVHHIRDMRTEFLVKVMMRQKLHMPIATFVAAQRDALANVTHTLGRNDDDSLVSMWRREQARAVVRFLDELEGRQAPSLMDEVDDSMVLSARNQLRGSVVSVHMATFCRP